MNRIVHMCLSVRGALNWPRRRLKGMFRDTETGRVLTPLEAREELLDHLSLGHEVIPMCQCPDFDFKKGCAGKTLQEENQT